MGLLDKTKRKLKQVGIGLVIGMKETEDETLHQSGLDQGAGEGIHQRAESKRVAQSLLRGEVTQAVKELRWRTYKVEEESHNWEYYTPTFAVKNMRAERVPVAYDDSDGRELVTIQENFAYLDENKTLAKVLGSIDKDSVKKDDSFKFDTDKMHGATEFDSVKRYTIEIDRDGFVPAKLENYIKKVVVKKSENPERAIFDCYVSIYPTPGDVKQKTLLNEIKRSMDGLVTDIYDMKLFAFTSHNAYRVNNGVRFEFQNIKLVSVSVYDGNYIIKLDGRIKYEDKALSDKYYSESMAKKYAEKAPKEATVVYSPELLQNMRTYVCEGCGKKVTYSPTAIDEMEITPDDEVAGTNHLEYMTMEMTKSTYGVFLCDECLEKRLANTYNELTNKQEDDNDSDRPE